MDNTRLIEKLESWLQGSSDTVRLVVIESPYAGDVQVNMVYLRKCFSDCINRGEVPIASHKLYTDIPESCDDTNRNLGLLMGYAWGKQCDSIVVYCDLGISEGMKRAIEFYSFIGKPITFRNLEEKTNDL